MADIRIGSHTVGPGRPCFIIAEVGINHNGDMDLARDCIAAAAGAGTDAVKFQNYRTEDFISDRALTYEYQSGGQMVVETQFDMFKRCELGPGDLAGLKEECDQNGVEFLATPTSEDGIRDLVAAGAPALKNGSDYLGNLRLIAAMAETGLPVIISTGMALEDEIAAAVTAFEDAGGKDLVILHCVSAYPAPDADLNLNKIRALAARFGHLTGFSDHSEGITAAMLSRALGACVVEKHFTMDKALPGPDHRFSCDPAGLRDLVAAIRGAEIQLGSAALTPSPSEMANREDFRLSCAAARDLEAGHVLETGDIAFRRPGTGVPPASVESLAGRALKQPVSQNHLFAPEDLEDE